jgi:peroxiredoxin
MPLQPATPAPHITAELLAQLGLKEDNKPIFLNFFRSDCPWCASEMPQLSEIYARHETLGAHIIGVAVGNDTIETTSQFAREKLLSFPTIADQNGVLKSAFAIERVPAIVAINARGLVERTYEGVTEQLPGILEQTLFALAHDSEPPEYDMIGNGCAP